MAERYGTTPEEHAEAVRRRYGKDRTFSVPILMTSALAGLVSWREVPPLPFELACFPQSLFRFLRLPVVSYALPALIAIGQAVLSPSAAVEPGRRGSSGAMAIKQESAGAAERSSRRAAASWKRRR